MPNLKQYSRADDVSLKTTEQDESITFSQLDYDHINTGSDTFFVTQTGSNLQYSVFNFKNSKLASGSSFSIKCIMKSDRTTTGASSYSPIYLDLYKIDTSAWENLYTNTSTGANGLFTISASKTVTPGKYYSTGSGDGNQWITSRIYQRAI